MDIYVNDNKIAYKPMFPLTWGNFFQKMLQEPEYMKKDHGIVKISIDGVDSLDVMLNGSDDLVPETIGEIRIYTKDSLSITRDGLAKVTTLIESIKKEISQAADLFREGKIKEGSTKITRIMEAFKPMINFINSIGISFSMNFDEMFFKQGITLREKIESFLKTFEDLLGAQQKKDYVELADYLEYQLMEDMEDWNSIAVILLKEAEANKATNA